jgi:hypothetical protein
MQTPLTNNKTHLFHVGNSKSLETLVDNCSTHHHSHHRDAQKEVEEVEEVEEVGEEAEETVEADYLLQQGQACSHHM